MNPLPAHPLGIYLFGLGGSFLLPILAQLGARWLNLGFAIAMSGMVLSALLPALDLFLGGPPLEITMAGALPPLSINLRFGPWEAAVSASAMLVAGLLLISFWPQIKGRYAPLLLLLMSAMGVCGLIQTRDLFNLFVFLEILSVGTYGLLALSQTPAGIQAAFKYVTATMVASALVLMGTVLLYEATGHLNIDYLIAAAPALGLGLAGIALAMVLAGFLIELKPYPAGGWGLDVYQTAPPQLAAFLSVVGSAGLIFAVGKLLPLYAPALDILIWSAALTFLACNLIGLRQENVFRLLGYSSIGQMALVLLALAFLTKAGADSVAPFILFGLFVNHLLAKAGLFCLAGALRARRVGDGLGLGARPGLLVLLGLFAIAICGLPPFPGFWAKWELILQLAQAQQQGLIAVILIGSLCEAAYLLRWVFTTVATGEEVPEAKPLGITDLLPILSFAALLLAAGVAGAALSGALTWPIFLPLLAGLLVWSLERAPGRLTGIVALATVGLGSLAMPQPDGIAGLLRPILLAGGLTIAAAGLSWKERRPGHYPLIAVLLLSIQALLSAPTGLAFYVVWEFITLAATFLILRQPGARDEALRFLIFSLGAAFLLMAGFALIAAQTGSRAIYAVGLLGPEASLGLGLLAVGFLIKAAAVGGHIWLPGAHSAVSADVSGLLSGVVTKTAIFGLLLTGYMVLRGQSGLDFGPILAWIGMATVLVGALLAVQQSDLKYLLAYSSMSQLGYIVTAIGLMGHLGWVTALYLVSAHMLVKGILFLAVGGVKWRLGSTAIADMGGLLSAMPITAVTVGLALLSMSGLPPLMGFGAKWLLLAAIMEKGWIELAIAGVAATLLGLIYMARVFVALFLGPQKRPEAREAPLGFLLPQLLLCGGIILLSFFPKLLMAPVSAAIDPEFSATLVWQGKSLETIYGLWDPTPVMRSAISIALLLGAVWWLLSRRHHAHLTGRQRLLREGLLPAWATPPLALRFWAGVGAMSGRVADLLRAPYNGSAHSYILQALIYFLFVAFGLSLAVPR